VVDFAGFRPVDSVGGVPICLAEAVDTPRAVSARRRARTCSTGRRSRSRVPARPSATAATSRIDRQQVFLSALIRQVQSKSLLTDAGTLLLRVDSVTQSSPSTPARD
jgi:anionic cell wall polymer biosynthesis LytR-Cps2A-Psr (LCP) family protein